MSVVHPAALIELKRDGIPLEPAELQAFLEAFMRGDVADYQMSAMLMAIFYRGLSPAELQTMTRCIIDSGQRLDFSAGSVPAVDKHSTGGVGDKVSLVLAPLLAEFGLRVPMMSGRGLGHSGGTLDKLESIPGFRTNIDLDEFRAIVAELGCAMIGQTEQITPLDGRLYALRDVTATVQSIPLISASIVSKKVAEGIGSLVLDVKVGRGAFIKDLAEARKLAETMVALAESLGLRTSALLTAMDEPLGCMVGNALEVREAVECLRGGGPDDFRDVTLELCIEAVMNSDETADAAKVRSTLEGLLASGAALDRLARLIERQGGDPRVIEDFDLLPSAPVVRPFFAPRTGYVAAFDAREVGMAAVQLGAGRMAVGDSVDPGVGFDVRCRVGERVERGEILAHIHARDDASAAQAAERLEAALELSESPTEAMPLVLEQVRTQSRP
ncbi:MAG: thymidine phosphorylase [Gemmatimonadales bacterium]|nr:MAG: thymidine phosphorylase [Gemmatimonadales bacterium]